MQVVGNVYGKGSEQKVNSLPGACHYDYYMAYKSCVAFSLQGYALFKRLHICRQEKAGGHAAVRPKG